MAGHRLVPEQQPAEDRGPAGEERADQERRVVAARQRVDVR